ncbi:acyl-CoA N-acyltransferase [Cytidiella melzeri]|nr:acyl-CoA N-acyltransferase [Cytidiella melzeri]
MRRTAKQAEQLVKRANKATAAQLSKDLPSTVCLNDTIMQVELKLASSLASEEREIIWKIADTNMRELASKSSMGWDEQDKKQELFDPLTSRFIIVRSTVGDEEIAADIAAFVMFRFEYDQGERLLYCYEIQVTEPWRKHGLGRFLASQIIKIASRWNMEKVMLTVLKANQGACRFYAAMGFIKDETSPDYTPEDTTEADVEPCDYDIMSFEL